MDYSIAAELPGLEAAKAAIDNRIQEIKAILSGNFSAPRELKPLPENDPTILGRDSLGRIKRKRTISPELRAQKIALITNARMKRLQQLSDQKQVEAPVEEAHRTAPKPESTSQGVVKNKR